jgi:hypothetical protein
LKSLKNRAPGKRPGCHLRCHCCCQVDDIKPPVFAALLHFLYTDVLPEVRAPAVPRAARLPGFWGVNVFFF